MAKLREPEIEASGPEGQPERTPHRYEQPALGWRNYWYPVLLAKEVTEKPRRVRVLGEDFVVYRRRGGDGSKLFALATRCAHRGAPLYLGKQQFPGSGALTCSYHGWTYDGETGEVLACLMEGPESKTPGTVRTKAYPVEERAGIVWVFIGDIAPPPVEEDIHPFLLEHDHFMVFAHYKDVRGAWRAYVENFCGDGHALYVHRNSPEMFFSLYPHGGFDEPGAAYGELEDGKGIGFIGGRRTGQRLHFDYPGLGRYPGRSWWRRPVKFKRPGPMYTGEGGKYPVDSPQWRLTVRMPGYVMSAKPPHGQHANAQWVVPLSEDRSRFWLITLPRKRGFLRNLLARAYFWLYYRWGHDLIFTGQDIRVSEDQIYGSEYLSYTDHGIIKWRRWAHDHARGGTGIEHPADA